MGFHAFPMPQHPALRGDAPLSSKPTQRPWWASTLFLRHSIPPCTEMPHSPPRPCRGPGGLPCFSLPFPGEALETLLALQAPGNISFPHPQEFLKQENQKTQMCKLLPGFSINHSWVELNEKALKCQPLQLVSTQSPILGWVPGEAGCQWRGLDPRAPLRELLALQRSCSHQSGPGSIAATAPARGGAALHQPLQKGCDIRIGVRRGGFAGWSS